MNPDTMKYNASQAPSDAEICDLLAREMDTAELKRWLGKAREIQWDYKNLIRRKGVLERLK